MNPIADFRFRTTRHQIPRGVRADAEQGKKIYLLKNVSVMHATYQVRLLAYRALKEGKKLVIKVPKHGERGESLRLLMKDNPNLILFDRE